jgi:predicted alpha/beta-hydrolase family hydrolase
VAASDVVGADGTHEIPTGQGPARIHVSMPGVVSPTGLVVLGHGAGGGIGAPDLVAAVASAVAAGWVGVLVEQPWKVAGRRVATRPQQLDEAWLAVMEALSGLGLPGARLVVGGRSAGARVACRTATATGADAVLCLAFPLHPPGKPERSRAEELNAPEVPVLVVQGERDPFGGPVEVRAALAPSTRITLVEVPGNHSLTASGRRVDPAVAPAVAAWLTALA